MQTAPSLSKYLVLPFALAAFTFYGCDGEPAPPAPPPGQLQHIDLAGRTSFRDGSPVNGTNVQYRLTVGGMGLFRPNSTGCTASDPHMQGALTLQGALNSAGRYAVSFKVGQATSVTNPLCSIGTLNVGSLDSLRIDGSIAADSISCPGFCAAEGTMAATNCVSDCESGERIIEASKTLTQADVQSLLSSSPAGALSWSQDLVFTQLGPPISSGLGPDLTVDAQAAIDSAHITHETFSATDCAMVEQCVGGTGARVLLRFSGNIQNVGTSDLVLGNPIDNPEFEYSACHNHYHLKNMMLYELLTNDTRQAVAVGSAGVIGRKQGFCVEDMIQVNGSTPSSGYTCDNQGLSAGWEDTYDSSLDCQWLDITSVPSGNYTLRITVNPDGIFPETNTSNNSAEVPVSIP